MLRDTASRSSQWYSFITLLFTLTLIHPCRGQSVIGPLQPVVALIGDDIILPCHLDPVVDASDMTVEWARPDLDPRFVLVWRDGGDLELKKHPLYDRRTSLFTHELTSGNVSLKISKVKLSDEGTYKCFVPEFDRYAGVQLLVDEQQQQLQCESAGWYPEPELLWLDGEGNLLPAAPAETLRGPDGLYAVSSRVTVEKKHSNKFTCRVQQKNISQSRETHIHVPDDFFISPPGIPTIITSAVVLILLLAVFCVLWKWRHHKCRNKTKDTKTMDCVDEGENEPLMTGTEEETAVDATGERTDTCPGPEKMKVKQETREEEEELTGKEEEEELNSRGEQSHKDERETQQVHFVSETEQISDICSPQEKRINPSLIIKKDKNTTERKTREEEAGRGRGVKAEGGGGETAGTEKPKEQQVFTDAQKKLQKNQRRELKEDQQREEDQRRLQSETRKDRDKDETRLKTQKNKDKQDLMEGNKENKTGAKKELDQDKNQLEFQPKTKPETKKVQTELKRHKDKDKPAPNNQDRSEGKPGGKKGKDQKGNQKREKKLPASSEVPERKNLTVQAATPENKEEVRAESLRGAESETAAQEEGIHTDETCRKNEEKETLQEGKGGEPWREPHLDMNQQLEEPVGLSEGGVASQEEPQQLMEVEENPHLDQNSMKGQKDTQQRALHTDQQETHEEQGRSFKRRKESEEEDDDDGMETEGEENNHEDVPSRPQRKRGKFQPDQELTCQEDHQEQMETQ